MRVISGLAKGRKLVAPVGLTTRPTADRMKETLFNMIAPDLLDADFLDLFAGSGAIGIEALSRGAHSAVFVDKSRESISAIQSNLKATKLAERATVLSGDVSEKLKSLAGKGLRFDIIFLDPPYGQSLFQKTLAQLAEVDVLKLDGFIVAEIGAEDTADETGAFSVFKSRKFSRTELVFLKPV